MSVMRIGHINIQVMDMDTAVKHYEKVLGMKVHLWDPFSKIDISSEPDAQVAPLTHRPFSR